MTPEEWRSVKSLFEEALRQAPGARAEFVRGRAGGSDTLVREVLSLLEAVPVGRPVHIMADSSYVIDACTKWRHGWKRKNWRTSSGEPVKNRDLMERLDSLMDTHTPTFEWVRGHQGHAENEAADVRARTVATSIQSGLNDWDPGPGLTC